MGQVVLQAQLTKVTSNLHFIFQLPFFPGASCFAHLGILRVLFHGALSFIAVLLQTFPEHQSLDKLGKVVIMLSQLRVDSCHYIVRK